MRFCIKISFLLLSCFCFFLSSCSSTKSYEISNVSEHSVGQNKLIRMRFHGKSVFYADAKKGGSTTPNVVIDASAQIKYDKNCEPYIIPNTFKVNIMKKEAEIAPFPKDIINDNSIEGKLTYASCRLHEQDHKRRIEGKMPYIAFRGTAIYPDLFVYFEGAAVSASIKNLFKESNISRLNPKWTLASQTEIVKKSQEHAVLEGAKGNITYWSAYLGYEKINETGLMKIYEDHVRQVHAQFQKELLEAAKMLANKGCNEAVKAEGSFTWQNGLKALAGIAVVAVPAIISKNESKPKSEGRSAQQPQEINSTEKKYCECGKSWGHLSNCNR